MAKKKSKSPEESYPSKADQRKWETEDGLRTLQRAEDIKKDKKLVADIKKLAVEQQKALNKITRSK